MQLKRAGHADLGHRLQGQARRHDAQFLQQNGDPLQAHRARRTRHGRQSTSALYGVPETYVVDKGGIVRWRWAGGLSDDVVTQYLAPLMQGLCAYSAPIRLASTRDD